MIYRRNDSTTVASAPGAIPEFIPALDGLRGVAILAVLLFHLGIPAFSLGWAGVELFFVISGFLITRILISTRTKPDYFRRFYYRRTLRIFPIYYLVLIAYGVAAFLAAGPVPHTLPFYYVYLQTIPQLQSQFTDIPVLGHTWSLAIEEQFYILWPVAVLVLRGRILLAVIASMIASGLGLRILALGRSNPFLVDGWLGVQIDCLAAGALVAYISGVSGRAQISRWALAAFTSGTAFLAIMVVTVGAAAFRTPLIWCRAPYGPFVITAMACACFGAVALVASGHPRTKWLELRPLMRVGKVSYGIYLYHPFVFLLVDNLSLQVFNHKSRLVSAVVMLGELLLTYIVAGMSWRVIESPINSMKNRIANGNGEPVRKVGDHERDLRARPAHIA